MCTPSPALIATHGSTEQERELAAIDAILHPSGELLPLEPGPLMEEDLCSIDIPEEAYYNIYDENGEIKTPSGKLPAAYLTCVPRTPSPEWIAIEEEATSEPHFTTPASPELRLPTDRGPPVVAREMSTTSRREVTYTEREDASVTLTMMETTTVASTVEVATTEEPEEEMIEEDDRLEIVTSPVGMDTGEDMEEVPVVPDGRGDVTLPDLERPPPDVIVEAEKERVRTTQTRGTEVDGEEWVVKTQRPSGADLVEKAREDRRQARKATAAMNRIMNRDRPPVTIRLTGCTEQERRAIVRSGLLQPDQAASALSPLAIQAAERALTTPSENRTEMEDSAPIVIMDDDESTETEKASEGENVNERLEEEAGERGWGRKAPSREPTPSPPVLSPITTGARYDYLPTQYTPILEQLRAAAEKVSCSAVDHPAPEEGGRPLDKTPPAASVPCAAEAVNYLRGDMSQVVGMMNTRRDRLMLLSLQS